MWGCGGKMEFREAPKTGLATEAHRQESDRPAGLGLKGTASTEDSPNKALRWERRIGDGESCGVDG
jgi:hypothetical protein